MDLRLAANLLTDRIGALPLAILYLTDRCNSRCVTCDYWKYGRTDLSLERARDLAPQLRQMGTRVVLLSGGEPLLNPQWAEIAATLREAGLRVWLLTAGLALRKHAARAAELCERITVSLDGATAETYRAIRGVDAFEAVCAGIRAVVRQGARVSLRCTVQRINYLELPALVRLGRAMGVEQVSFLAVDVSTHAAFARQEDYDRTMALRSSDLPPFAAVLDALEEDFAAEFASGFIAERPEKLRRLHQYFSGLLDQSSFPPVHCNAPRFSAVIGADGHLSPCYFIPGPTSTVNRQPSDFKSPLEASSLPQSLNSREFLSLRRDIRAGRREECAKCVCSMWRGAAGLMLDGF